MALLTRPYNDGIANIAHPYRGVLEAFTPFGFNKNYGGNKDDVLVVASGATVASFSSAVGWTGVTDGVEMEFQMMTFNTGVARKLGVGFSTNTNQNHFINTDRDGTSYGSGFLQLEYGTLPNLLNFNTRTRYGTISNLNWHTIKIVSSLSAGSERLFYNGELVASGSLVTTTGSGVSFFNVLNNLVGPLIIRLKTIKITVDGNVVATNFFADTNTNTIVCPNNPNYNFLYNNTPSFGQQMRFSTYRAPTDGAIALDGLQIIEIPETLNPLGTSPVDTCSLDISFITGHINTISVQNVLLDFRDSINHVTNGIVFTIGSPTGGVSFVIMNPNQNNFISITFPITLLNGARNVRLDFYGTQRGSTLPQNVDIFLDGLIINPLCTIPNITSFNLLVPVGRKIAIGNLNQPARPFYPVSNTFFESCRFYPNDPSRLGSPSFDLQARYLDVANDCILDVSGNNRHATLSPSKTTDSPNHIVVRSPYSVGIELNGTDQYASIPNPFTSSGYNVMTTQRPCILKVQIRNPNTAPTTTRSLISRRLNSGTFAGFELFINSNGQICFYTGENQSTSNFLEVATTATTYNSPNLYMDIEVRYDGSKLASGVQILVDGVSVPTTVVANTCTGNNNDTGQVLGFFHRPTGVQVYGGRVFLISARFGTVGGGLASCVPMFEYEANTPLIRFAGTNTTLVSSVQRSSANINYLIPFLQFINAPQYVMNIDKP